MKKYILLFVLVFCFIISAFGQKTNIDPFNVSWEDEGNFEWLIDIKLYAKNDISDKAWFEKMKKETNQNYTATYELKDYTISSAKPPMTKVFTPHYDFEWSGYYEKVISGYTNDDYIVVAKMSLRCYSISYYDYNTWVASYANNLVAGNKKTLGKDNKGTYLHYVYAMIGNINMVENFINYIENNQLSAIVLALDAPSTRIGN